MFFGESLAVRVLESSRSIDIKSVVAGRLENGKMAIVSGQSVRQRKGQLWRFALNTLRAYSATDETNGFQELIFDIVLCYNYFTHIKSNASFCFIGRTTA